jgi:hypothetical protein
VGDRSVSNQVSSSVYESWIVRMRANQGTARRRIMGGLARVLGDLTIEWGTQANLEHLPSYASDKSIALIASERQLDTYPGEPTADLAARAPFWLQLAKFRGTSLGILLGLHFSGFDGAVVVQQNGRAFQLTLPLPPFVLGQTWDPKPNLVLTSCTTLAAALTSSVTPPTASSAGRSIPVTTQWWQFAEQYSLDTQASDTDCCSRFAVLFPTGSIPAPFLLGDIARATFTASDTAPVTWSVPFSAGMTNYLVQCGPAIVTDGGGPVTVSADASTRTLSGVTVRASAPFTGYCDVVASPGLSGPDRQRLQATLAKWRPAKASCVGVYVCIQGKFMAWPPQTQATNTMGVCTIVRFDGA